MPPGPTALVAATDHTPWRLIERLEAAGTGFPATCRSSGSTGSPSAALPRIALTTVVQPADELARRAVELLRSRIDRGHDAPPRSSSRLSPRLIVRGSTRSLLAA